MNKERMTERSQQSTEHPLHGLGIFSFHHYKPCSPVPQALFSFCPPLSVFISFLSFLLFPLLIFFFFPIPHHLHPTTPSTRPHFSHSFTRSRLQASTRLGFQAAL